MMGWIKYNKSKCIIKKSQKNQTNHQTNYHRTKSNLIHRISPSTKDAKAMDKKTTLMHAKNISINISNLREIRINNRMIL